MPQPFQSLCRRYLSRCRVMDVVLRFRSYNATQSICQRACQNRLKGGISEKRLLILSLALEHAVAVGIAPFLASIAVAVGLLSKKNIAREKDADNDGKNSRSTRKTLDLPTPRHACRRRCLEESTSPSQKRPHIASRPHVGDRKGHGLRFLLETELQFPVNLAKDVG